MTWAWLGPVLIILPVVFMGLMAVFPKPKTLWKRGRWALIFDACDCWIGGYYSREKRALYLILIPTLPIRYRRA